MVGTELSEHLYVISSKIFMKKLMQRETKYNEMCSVSVVDFEQVNTCWVEETFDLSFYSLYIYLKWTIKHPGYFFKSKSFWVEGCSDWMNNQTWALIKKSKNKKYQASKNFRKINQILFVILFKLAPNFTWLRIRNFPQRMGAYLGWVLN